MSKDIRFNQFADNAVAAIINYVHTQVAYQRAVKNGTSEEIRERYEIMKSAEYEKEFADDVYHDYLKELNREKTDI